MMDKIRASLRAFGLPRIIIAALFIVVTVASTAIGIPFSGLARDVVIRVSMNLIFVLAMVPAILSGIGPNFGLPLGILCGLLGAIISIEMDLRNGAAFMGAILISIPFAVLVGWAYGWLLNKVKGSEMMVATYAGFSAVFLMSIGWMLLPFNSPEMGWPMGKGLRVTIALEGRFRHILNDLWEFNIGKFTMPTGLVLFGLLICLIVWFVLRSKMGIALKTVGSNPRFAEASGLNVDKYRIIGSILSTVLGAIGIVVYAQSFGFLQLYQAPLFMGFTAVAAVFIGGANIKNASITNVLIGAFLYHGLLVVALPLANNVVNLENMAEITRLIMTHGIILYALTQVGGE